ncbi:class I SAM-dependent methyltransferase [Deinococcus lacus]|uniref:Class I SAM-dependent methyltransferase n=1 Tax=Deinococcus lacus TaxID=392561 RepID=A0ABW1YAK8_9DEIO
MQREWLSPPEPVWGEARPEIVALEGGVPFLFRPGADLSIGLFADARPLRAWVREQEPAGQLLNAFAYTCGFGVMGTLAGYQVKNIDLSRKVLAWGQANYALSGLADPDQDFLYGDVFDWLRRLKKRGERFDLVVLDPPSFARSQRGVWRAERDYAALAGEAAALLTPQGRLLAVTNHAGISAAALSRMVGSGLAAAGRQGQFQLSLGPGPDWPGATHLRAQVWS